MTMHRAALTETQFKRQVVTQLRAWGWTVYVTSERRRGYSKMPTGLPDLFVRHVLRRRHAWIELKRPGEALRAAQKEFRDAALVAGEEHWVLESGASVEQFLMWVPPLLEVKP